MRKLSVFCFFVFLIPALGCIGSASIEHALLANLSEVTNQTDEEALSTVVFTLLESMTGAEIDTVIEENGQGVIRYGFAYEPSTLQQAVSELPPGFMESINCDSATKLLMEDAPDGSTLVEERRRSEVWCMVSIPFDNLLELVDRYQSILTPLVRSNQTIESTAAAPLVGIRCLELVDGMLYQDLTINQSAIKPEDVELLDVFGIDVQWRLTMASPIRYHNATDVLSSPLSWNLLDLPERLAVNVTAEDACPSSRVKLLLEFTTTNTTLATLTIPISRRADDYLQNEAVRQRLSQHGWVTQIEGSANHSPRIVALQQFERGELSSLLSTIPGIKAFPKSDDSHSARSNSALPITADAESIYDIELDLDSFSNTWALLMPTQAPKAFEVVINSMRPVATVDGASSDPLQPFLLWNSSSEETKRDLAFSLQDDSETLIVIAEDDALSTDASESDDAKTNLASSQNQDLASPTRAVGVLGPQSPNRVADLSASRPISIVTATPEPTATPSTVASSIAEQSGTIAVDSISGSKQGVITAKENDRIALSPNVPLRSTLENGETEVERQEDEKSKNTTSSIDQGTVQTIGDLIENEPSRTIVAQKEDTAADEKSVNDAQKNPVPEENQPALALRVADILGESKLSKTSESASPITRNREVPLLSTIDSSSEEVSAFDLSLPTCKVVIEWLNLRPGPGQGYGKPIAALPQETDLRVIGQDSWGTWIKVIATATSGRGWVSLDPTFVTCQGDFTDVPKIDPATISVTATTSPENSTVTEQTDIEESTVEQETAEINAVPTNN